MPTPVDKQAESTVWITPPHIWRPLSEAVGGFDLDPCTEPSNPTEARRFYTEADDGLARPWSSESWRSRVWVNPPYGRDYQKWAAKIAHEASALVPFRDDGLHMALTIIALLPANRTETAYMHDLFAHDRLRAVCYVRKRVGFLRPDGSRAKSNVYASSILVFGECSSKLMSALRGLGVVFRGPADKQEIQ